MSTQKNITMHTTSQKLKTNRRSDSEWVATLSGALGNVAQEEGLNDLARYLYVVIYNNLSERGRSIPLLRKLHQEELADLTLDFVQQFMEKLVRDDYDLLRKYHAKGRFTAWASQVMLNIISSELRKAHWLRQEPLQERIELAQRIGFEDRSLLGDRTTRPEEATLNGQLGEVLQVSIDGLPSRMRAIFIRRVIEGESATAIAEEMDVSINVVHMLVHRAKKQIRRFLNEAGMSLDEVMT